MTISFYCPDCNALIAFHDRHAGKRGKCLTCGQRLIIPAQSDQVPQKIEPEPAEPLSGFYRAALLESWKLFVRPSNTTGLLFIAAAVCFKFFTGHLDYSFTMGAFRAQLPVGFVVSVSAWGCLLWYYMEIIHAAAFDDDLLAESYIGGFFGFAWNILKSIYLFFIAFLIVQLPLIITIVIFGKPADRWPLHLCTLALLGLFLFPMAILTIAVGKDFPLLRPDYILAPITKALMPYILVAALLSVTWNLQLKTLLYGQLADKSIPAVTLHLLASLAVQVPAIIAMRSIGLFYRHFNCYFKW